MNHIANRISFLRSNKYPRMMDGNINNTSIITAIPSIVLRFACEQTTQQQQNNLMPLQTIFNKKKHLRKFITSI